MQMLFFTDQHSHLHQRDQDSGSEAEIFSHGWKQRHRTFHVRGRFLIQLLGDTFQFHFKIQLNPVFFSIGKQLLAFKKDINKQHCRLILNGVAVLGVERIKRSCWLTA